MPSKRKESKKRKDVDNPSEIPVQKQHKKHLMLAHFLINVSLFVPVVCSTNLLPNEIKNPKDLSAAYFAAQVLSLSLQGVRPSSSMILFGRIIVGFIYFTVVVSNKNASWKSAGATIQDLGMWLLDYCMAAIHLLFTLYCLKNPPHRDDQRSV